MKFTIDQLVNLAQMTKKDLKRINQCRRQHNKLGFGYQLSFVKLLNRFPVQQPFEATEDILNYVSVEIGVPANSISLYAQRRETIAEHQEQIRQYLDLQRFGETVVPKIHEFLFNEACRLEQTGALLAKVEHFLRSQKILAPSMGALRRMIGSQRKAAGDFLFTRIAESLSPQMVENLDSLLYTNDKRLSDFHLLKQPPARPSPSAMLKLIEKLKKIETTGILDVDLSWLSNNFQRSLTHYTKHCDANKMRELDQGRRYAALSCLIQLHTLITSSLWT